MPSSESIVLSRTPAMSRVQSVLGRNSGLHVVSKYGFAYSINRLKSGKKIQKWRGMSASAALREQVSPRVSRNSNPTKAPRVKLCLIHQSSHLVLAHRSALLLRSLLFMKPPRWKSAVQMEGRMSCQPARFQVINNTVLWSLYLKKKETTTSRWTDNCLVVCEGKCYTTILSSDFSRCVFVLRDKKNIFKTADWPWIFPSKNENITLWQNHPFYFLASQTNTTSNHAGCAEWTSCASPTTTITRPLQMHRRTLLPLVAALSAERKYTWNYNNNNISC